MNLGASMTIIPPAPFGERTVALAFAIAIASKLRGRGRYAEVEAAEDAAYELHDAEYHRLLAANGVGLEPVWARQRRRRC